MSTFYRKSEIMIILLSMTLIGSKPLAKTISGPLSSAATVPSAVKEDNPQI